MSTPHRQFCLAARKWLLLPSGRGGPGCRIALTEVQTPDAREVADAYGVVTSGTPHSILVEVKISRADFLADRKKPHRNGERPGLGMFRYYAAPTGVLRVEDLPPRWGLLEFGGRPQFRIQAGHLVALQQANRSWHESWAQVLEQWGHDSDSGSEIGLLAQTLSRLGDPDKFNTMLKDKSNDNVRLAKQADRLHTENRNLYGEIARLKFALAHPELAGQAPKAMPRVPRESSQARADSQSVAREPAHAPHTEQDEL